MKFCMHTRKQPRLRLFAIALAIATALGAFHTRDAGAAEPGAARAPANRYAATIVAAERFEVDGVLVERHGAASGRALILVPGLASGSWAWQDTIRTFSADHPVYVLTLPGFDGRPPAHDGPFGAARGAIEALIASRHLDRPVLVGHSLGGVLGFAVAEDQPAALGGLVSIDGLPVLPGTETMAPEQRLQAAESLRGRVADLPPARFAEQQQAYMRTIGVMDMDRADALARLSSRSDPASVGAWVADTMALDLRPGLGRIAAPVLVLAPYLDLDSAQRGITPDATLDYYRALLQGTPRLQVALVAPARHFAMLDQPQAVNDAIRTFLDGL